MSLCTFARARVCFGRLLELGAIHSKNTSFRRVFLDERTVFFEQMRDEFALEKVGRIAHCLLMMPIKAKNVREKAHLEFCLRNSQP